MHSCSAEQKLCLRIILEPVKLLQPLREFDAETEPELVFAFFGQADQTSRIGFAFLRYAESEKRTLLTEIIPVERLAVIIKIIHFLMRLRPKQSIEMPKQLIEICKLINL